MEDLYDEFGNYIGPEGESVEDVEEQIEEIQPTMPLMPMDLDQDISTSQVVLHEDKQYYPYAEQIYGPGVEIKIEEDTQPLTEPIIAPAKVKRFQIEEQDLPTTTYSKEFLAELCTIPERVRNIAVVGHLHHGKTSLLDMFVSQTHSSIKWNPEKQQRYTDVHILEQQRGLTIQSQPISLLVENSKRKSLLVNFLDTPGHANFIDQVSASIRLSDAIVLVVDAIDGMMSQTEAVIKLAIQESCPITLVINKMDRLILELKYPPNDAYYKLKHVIDEINTLLVTLGISESQLLSPERGNVCFASTNSEWIFSLTSFSRIYANSYTFDIDEFAKRLWGDIYYDPSSKKFIKTPGSLQRSFVHFVLEPLYKIYGQVLGSESSDNLISTFSELGISLRSSQYNMDSKSLLYLVFSQFFKRDSSCFVDMIEMHCPSPIRNAKAKLERIYTGPFSDDDNLINAMQKCDLDGPLSIYVTKLVASSDGSRLDALGRIISGTITQGQSVLVLGESYSMRDEDDMSRQIVKDIWISGGRYRMRVNSASAGAIVILGGVDSSITKTATILNDSQEYIKYIFRPLCFPTIAAVKVAIEPSNPTELPKLLEGIRKLTKIHPILATHIEESGEHVLFGTGELYLDCILHDLKRLFAEIDIKVSDPTSRFCETVVDVSSLKCSADSPNRKNRLVMIAEPLDKGISEDIETGRLKWTTQSKILAKEFQNRYEWDILASRNIWAFGPDELGPNILIDDTLPSEVDKRLLNNIRESICQGFCWGVKEGPLCDEPIRGVKFKLLDAQICEDPLYRGGGQIIPTARRVVYSSFFTASPRLMEPVYQIEIQAPADCTSIIYNILSKRRGHILQDIPKAGSPLYTIRALVPVIDSFGFETDIRTHTQGLAFCQQFFDHWQIVPGDPLDKSITIVPLEPSPATHLARDFMIKTRRRKGLSEDVGITKFFDEYMLFELSKQQQQDQTSLA